MSIQKAGIWCNRNKAEALEAAERLIEALNQHGIRVGLDEALYARMPRAQADRGLDGSDLIITLGGDGTLLSGIGEAMRLDAPMLGVNLGHVGFLTEIEPYQIRQAVSRLARGEYKEEKRMLLRAGGYDQFGLNDVSVTRSQTSTRILTLTVRLDGKLIQRFAGDGLIISTPTGSTGYSMSAGGPLVTPGVDLILLTPICAHTPHAKPTIVPAGSAVEVELEDQCEAVLAMDGRTLGILPAGGRATICRADKPARFIRMSEPDFFGRLKSKLLDWGT
ncbi:MAG: NAD(+)/NADH kinase [Clostridia bacterium]|nr:NAD(+)/NADH kinase [Clostridia bacterium]